jgi:hypothetical protein
MLRVDLLERRAFSQRYDLMRPERGSTNRVASALPRPLQRPTRAGRGERNATPRIALTETRTAHTWKTQTQADAQAGSDEGRSLNPKRFLFFVLGRNEAPPSNSM